MHLRTVLGEMIGFDVTMLSILEVRKQNPEYNNAYIWQDLLSSMGN